MWSYRDTSKVRQFWETVVLQMLVSLTIRRTMSAVTSIVVRETHPTLGFVSYNALIATHQLSFLSSGRCLLLTSWKNWRRLSTRHIIQMCTRGKCWPWRQSSLRTGYRYACSYRTVARNVNNKDCKCEEKTDGQKRFEAVRKAKKTTTGQIY